MLAEKAGLTTDAIVYPGFIDEAHKAAIIRGARVFRVPVAV